MNFLNKLLKRNNVEDDTAKLAEVEELATIADSNRKQVFLEFDRYVKRMNELEGLVDPETGYPVMLVMAEANKYAQDLDKQNEDEGMYYFNLFDTFLDQKVEIVHGKFTDNSDGLIRVVLKEDDEGEILWYKYRPNIDTEPVQKSLDSLTHTLNEMMMLERYRDDDSDGSEFQTNGYFEFALSPSRDYHNLESKDGSEPTADEKINGLKFIISLQQMAITMLQDAHACIDDCYELYDLINSLEEDNKNKFIAWLEENNY